MEKKCLCCYKEIYSEELTTEAGTKGYHEKCSKKFFGKINPPKLNFTENQILDLAEQVIKSQKTVTGV
jgi:serine/threonine-protein kinase HipA